MIGKGEEGKRMTRGESKLSYLKSREIPGEKNDRGRKEGNEGRQGGKG